MRRQGLTAFLRAKTRTQKLRVEVFLDVNANIDRIEGYICFEKSVNF